MATCTETGETFDTTELTDAKTGEISAETGAMFTKTGVNCGMTYEIETTEPREPSGATSTKTGVTFAPTAAIFGMTAETSGTIAETFTTTAEGDTPSAADLGEAARAAAGTSCRRVSIGDHAQSRIQTWSSNLPAIPPTRASWLSLSRSRKAFHRHPKT